MAVRIHSRGFVGTGMFSLEVLQGLARLPNAKELVGAEDGGSPGIRSFPLQGIENLFDGVGHS